MRKIHKPAKRGSISPRAIRAAVKKVTEARNSSKKEKTKRGSALSNIEQLREIEAYYKQKIKELEQ